MNEKVAALRSLLGSPDPDVGAGIRALMRGLPDGEVDLHLETAFVLCADEREKGKACLSLSSCRRRVVTGFLGRRLLPNNGVMVRRMAAAMILWRANPGISLYVCNALPHEEDKLVQGTLITALGLSGDRSALGLLEPYLTCSSNSLRMHAVCAYLDMGVMDERVRDVLRDLEREGFAKKHDALYVEDDGVPTGVISAYFCTFEEISARAESLLRE